MNSNDSTGFTVRLDVPSGAIVFGNDLRQLVTLASTDDSYDTNRISELARLTKDYAAVGMIHAFVGNTMPGVYQLEDGSIAVQTQPWDERTDEEVEVNGERLGTICTDLWWFSAMDADYFEQRCQQLGLDPEEFAPGWTTLIKVPVERGEWVFSIDYDSTTNDDASGVVYSRATRVGPCVGRTALVDPFTTPASLLESHFWDSWTRAHARYGHTIFPTMGVWLEHRFCVLGNGCGWVNGRLGHQDRDEPYVTDLNTSWIGDWRHSVAVDSIPEFDAEHLFGSNFIRRVYPMYAAHGPTASRAPLDVDVYWLAAALVFFKGLVRTPQILCQSEELADQVFQVFVARRTLDILCTIASVRELWGEPLDRIFAEFREHALPVMVSDL